MKREKKVEGFWRQTEHDDSTDLPFPEAQPAPWEGQEAFLVALACKERVAKKTAYRGYSHCRICDEPNGHSECERGGWRWPRGLRHYVEQHNVRPSDDFIAFILADSLITCAARAPKWSCCDGSRVERLFRPAADVSVHPRQSQQKEAAALWMCLRPPRLVSLAASVTLCCGGGRAICRRSGQQG